MSTAHIYIYGEIGFWQANQAAEYGEVNLTHVREQYNAQKDCEDIHVHIHSNGGYVTEGFAIHDFLKAQGKPITTTVEGMCYSIATVIALAGDKDKRFMTSNAEYMVHFPTNMAYGTADDMQREADSLRKLEAKAAQFYSDKTGLTYDEAMHLMKDDTFMSTEDALKNKFISAITPTMKAIAKINIKNLNTTTMSKPVMTKEQTESKLDRMLANMKKFIVGEQPTMKMVLAADGTTEIDFTELADDDMPAVDDVATVDGSPAEGEHLMPNGETYVFAAGVLTEIKPAESDDEDQDDDSEEMAQLKADNAEMKAKAAKDAKAIKALEKSNAEMKASLEENKNLMKGFQKDMEAVKASMKSDFQSEEGSGNDKKPGKKTQTRKVFK